MDPSFNILCVQQNVILEPRNLILGLSLNPALRQRMENNVFLSGPDSFTTEKKEKIPVLLLWLCFHQAYSNNIA